MATPSKEGICLILCSEEEAILLRDPQIASLTYALIHERFEKCLGFITVTSKIYENVIDNNLDIISIGNLHAN